MVSDEESIKEDDSNFSKDVVVSNADGFRSAIKASFLSLGASTAMGQKATPAFRAARYEM
jgi:hypothetical protein